MEDDNLRGYMLLGRLAFDFCAQWGYTEERRALVLHIGIGRDGDPTAVT